MPDRYGAIFRWLNLAPPSDVRNEFANQSQPAQPMSDAIRAQLTEYYRPHNDRLFGLLGEATLEWPA